MAINLGDAFLIDTPPSSRHLYIAIAQTSPKKYLFVSVSTRRQSSETTCVLLPGSGVPNFITYESFVAYHFAREIEATELAHLIAVGSAILNDSCSKAVLTRIQQRGLESKRLKKMYKKLKAFLEKF